MERYAGSDVRLEATSASVVDGGGAVLQVALATVDPRTRCNAVGRADPLNLGV